MYGYTVLTHAKSLRIFIDSLTINSLLSKKSEEAKVADKILKWSDCEIFEFVRSPLSTTHESLAKVHEYEINYAAQGSSILITAHWKNYESQTELPEVETLSFGSALYLFQTKQPPQDIIYRLKEIFALSKQGMNREQPDLFVTDDKKLLNKRIWLQEKMPCKGLMIVSVREAWEIMDLFCKFNERYYLTPLEPWKGKSIWYWISFRTNVPRFNVEAKMPISAISSDVNEAFAMRFQFLLLAVDELGIQFYLRPNLDTEFNMMYHFNHFMSLVVGIFDNLALTTQSRLGVTFEGDWDIRKVSLSSNTGNEFLTAFGTKNFALGKLVCDNRDFINLMFDLRHLMIHREGLKSLSSGVGEADGSRWEDNYASIDPNLAGRIRHVFGDKKLSYEKVGSSGLREIHRTLTLVLPFFFSKSIMEKLIPFCNTYLQLLGYDSFLQNISDKQFKYFISSYEQFHLGL